MLGALAGGRNDASVGRRCGLPNWRDVGRDVGRGSGEGEFSTFGEGSDAAV